jgi:cell division protein FtsB
VGFLGGLRISTFIFSIGLIYFAVHFFIGQQGLLSWRGYVQRSDELSLERDRLSARRTALEVRMGRLQPGKTDADFVEERAFSQLGLVGPTDIVILLPTKKLASQTPATVVTPDTQPPISERN